MGRTDGKELFENVSGEKVGVMQYGPKGEERWGVVEQGERVYLSPEEQEITHLAHKKPEETSPFVEQDYAVRDEETEEVIESGRRAPLRKIPMTGTAPEVPADPERTDGSFAPGEESGVPRTG